MRRTNRDSNRRGRPKKSEPGTLSTRERLLCRALELFAVQGFHAVSVRDITKSLGLNEAALYNHFPSKASLLEAIVERFERTLIEPGFRLPEPERFMAEEPFDLAAHLILGVKAFLSRANQEVLLTWRVLMLSQYGYAPARRSLESGILDAPVRFFSAMLDAMKSAGRIRPDTDCTSAGRVIAAVFFDFSFRSNLRLAWNEMYDEDFGGLESDLRFLTRTLEL